MREEVVKKNKKIHVVIIYLIALLAGKRVDLEDVQRHQGKMLIPIVRVHKRDTGDHST